MHKPTQLSQLVLAAVHHLTTAHSSAITQYVNEAGLPAPAVSVFKTLQRLEADGFVRSTMGQPTPARGGKARRLYVLTLSGKDALANAIQSIRRIAEGVEGETHA